MKRYTLEREQTINKPRSEVFSFFEKPENLALITPPSMQFKILTPRPVSMESGVLIDYTLRIFGVRQRWTTLILIYDPPHEFIDVQLRGPYTFWRHTHRFDETPDGTRVIDRVEYIVPHGILGRMLHSFFIRRQLRSIFDFRSRKIEEIFADGHASPSIHPSKSS